MDTIELKNVSLEAIEHNNSLTYKIENLKPSPNQTAIWWMGQSGFIVRFGNSILCLDPYLSTRLEKITENKPRTKHVRMIPIPVIPSALRNIDYIICSHNHGDHFDPDTVIPILGSNPHSKLIIPPAATESAVKWGINRQCIIPVGVGDKWGLDEFEIQAVIAKHNEFDYSIETGYPYVGYIIKFQGITLYHAGDTIYFDELPDMLADFNIDIALLPINGGDRDRIERGFMSNMQFWESADLAARLKVKLVIPTHFNMFTINTENIERFEYYMNRKYPEIKYVVPKIGEAIVFP